MLVKVMVLGRPSRRREKRKWRGFLRRGIAVVLLATDDRPLVKVTNPLIISVKRKISHQTSKISFLHFDPPCLRRELGGPS